jgi:hypothetical protein
MPDVATLVQETLIDLDADDCDLQWIFDLVRRVSPGASYDDIRRSTLRVLGELLACGLAEPHLVGETFRTADPSASALEQISQGWDRFGEDLTMGEVAYFTITPAGEAALRSSSHSSRGPA